MRRHTRCSGRLGVVAWVGMLILLVGLPPVGYARTGLHLGSVGPGGQLVYERAIQLYVTGTGPFHIDAMPPTHFTDIEEPSRSIPAHVLEWRVTGSGSEWRPMRPGLPTTVWREETPGSHVIELDYRVSPTWGHPASAGGYVLDVPYRVVGQAALIASTVWPNPAAVGGRITVACIRQQAVDETLRLVVMDGSGVVLGEEEQPVTSERAEVEFVWEVSVPPGTWVFKLQGDVSGLCAFGHLRVNGDARITSQGVQDASRLSQEAPAIVLQADFNPPAAIGQWTTLRLRLVNPGPSALNDVRVVLQLPRGLRPIAAHEDEFYIPHLAAGGEWTHALQLAVTPGAKPSIARVGLQGTESSTGVPIEMWTDVQFRPSVDRWLQPEVILHGRGGPGAARVEIDGGVVGIDPDGAYRGEVSQGWHPIWAIDAMGQRLTPVLIDVRGGAPLGYDLFGAVPKVSTTSEARGVLSLTADSTGIHPSFDGVSNVRIHGVTLLSRMYQMESGGTQSSWQLNSPELGDPAGFGTVSGALLGEGATVSGLRLGWQMGGEGKVGALRFTYDRGLEAGDKAQWSWRAHNPAGGVEVRHTIQGDQDSIGVAVWRKASDGAPAFRIEHDTSGPGIVRLGTGHRVRSPWGQMGVSALWSLAPSNGTTSTHLSLGWQGHATQGVRPFAGLTFDPAGWRTQVGLSLRQTSTEQTVLIGYGSPYGALYVDWLTRRRDPSTESRVALDLSSRAARGRASIADAYVGPVRLEADVEVEMEGESAAISATVRLDEKWRGAQWITSVSTSRHTSQVDHRVDGRTQMTLGTRQATVGLLMGVRSIHGTVGGDKVSTRTTFVGGWGEVEVFPGRWAGVALAKWNSASWVEYDVYLRYEATPSLWLQLGYHQAPGAITLFPDHGRGAYARMMWAVHTGW